MARTCIRCKSKLSNNFCAACGIAYGSAADPKAQLGKNQLEVEETVKRNRFWRNVRLWLFWWMVR